MNAAVHPGRFPLPLVMRWFARAAGVVLMVIWVELVINELAQYGAPDSGSYSQAAALAVVFAGYAIGWRNELIGGSLSIIGTIALVVVYILSFGAPPNAALTLFAGPGVLYLLTWLSEQHDKSTSRSI